MSSMIAPVKYRLGLPERAIGHGNVRCESVINPEADVARDIVVLGRYPGARGLRSQFVNCLNMCSVLTRGADR
jgi:hypothetical protein